MFWSKNTLFIFANQSLWTKPVNIVASWKKNQKLHHSNYLEIWKIQKKSICWKNSNLFYLLQKSHTSLFYKFKTKYLEINVLVFGGNHVFIKPFWFLLTFRWFASSVDTFILLQPPLTTYRVIGAKALSDIGPCFC